MADGIVTRIEGLQDLKIAVEALKQDLRKRVVRGALLDAARPMVQTARNKAPSLKSKSRYRTAGLLKRSIRVFGSKQNNGRNGVLGVYIAVRGNSRRIKAAGGRGAKNPNDPFYWWWQEFGFTAVGRGKLRGGTRRRSREREARVRAGAARKIPGIGFMRAGFENNKNRAVDIFQSRIKARIDKANTRI